VKRYDDRRVETSEWVSWAIIGAVALACVLGFALAAHAQDSGPIACRPGPNTCDAKIKAPASPSVDRVCLRKVGTTALVDALCVAAAPGADVKIAVSNPPAGSGHVYYDVVACDDDLHLCSQPAVRQALSVDLDNPTLVDLIVRLLGEFGGLGSGS